MKRGAWGVAAFVVACAAGCAPHVYVDRGESLGPAEASTDEIAAEYADNVARANGTYDGRRTRITGTPSQILEGRVVVKARGQEPHLVFQDKRDMQDLSPTRRFVAECTGRGTNADGAIVFKACVLSEIGPPGSGVRPRAKKRQEQEPQEEPAPQEEQEPGGAGEAG
ncbi:MAG: hypothetical protein HY744_22335 [Deltaproteobacteria bacterium]|nr:hypothetical protein [Deltaproteobacteria bacterium]